MASHSCAQQGENFSISADSLEFYLVQAFQASTASERMALNHIGIEVEHTEEGFLITAALEGYPAHQAGLERGDTILRVDGQPFHPIHSLNNTVSDSGGFSSATAPRQLEYERMGDVSTVEIAAVFENLYDSYRTATLNSVQEFALGNKTIGYIRLWGLSRSTAELFTLEALLADFSDSDGLIVDLRNSYGYLSSKHLDLFSRDGRGYFDASDASNRHAAISPVFPTGSAHPFTKPIVVLINSETRGGAELLAYGLSKVGRITTLGARSRGRIGSYSLQGASLNYAPADETLIDGQRFEAVGVAPKESIPFPFDQAGRSDPQFEASVDILLGTI